MPTQPTINNLERWEEFLEKYRWMYSVFYIDKNREQQNEYERFEKRLKQFISDIRKHDMEELIKMLPKADNLYYENGQFLSSYKKEVEQLIKDYYVKSKNN